MYTDDDMLVTRWQRWHRRVMGLDVDTLLRWTLVASVPVLVVSTVLTALSMVISVATSIIRWVY